MISRAMRRPSFRPTTSKSWRAWRLIQNSGEVPKYRPSRNTVSAVIPRASEHDVVEPRAGHLEGLRQDIDAELQWLQEIGAKNLPRMDRRKSFSGRDLGKIDPARIQIFALDAHGLIPCGTALATSGRWAPEIAI